MPRVARDGLERALKPLHMRHAQRINRDPKLEIHFLNRGGVYAELKRCLARVAPVEASVFA